MASYYTDKICEGQSFEDFVLLCARRTGACISMRDKPLSAPIPDKIEPELSYYEESLRRSEEELKDLNELTENEKKKRFQKFIKSVKNEIKEIQEKRSKKRMHYNVMLRKVKAWNPPTDDHVEFKKFMIEQIESSIKWDCSIYDREIPECDYIKFHEETIQLVKDSIKRYKKYIYDEIKSAEKRTKWIQDLKGSLKK